jgi:hypothetical protein
MVKPKTAKSNIFKALFGPPLWWFLPVFSLLTFISTWAGAFRASRVELWYARGVFPTISHLAGRLADAIPFSWLDVVLPLGAILLAILVWKRQWPSLVNLAAGLYLLFFWTWGLNYHRQPLQLKLQLDSERMGKEAMAEFTREAAAQLNRLYREREKGMSEDSQTQAEAVRRVRRVIALIDNSDWESARRIKTSRITNPWLHAAGIDGVFNPFPHEPIVSDTLLDIERPFVIAHELAHVRGYPDEGDANLIATFATLLSDDPSFQYSGWLNLWLYLRNRELDELLDPGPRQDLRRISERARREQIGWINDLQQTVLDWFLKANRVEEGVQSYSRAVLLAAGTEPYWDRYR